MGDEDMEALKKMRASGSQMGKCAEIIDRICKNSYYQKYIEYGKRMYQVTDCDGFGEMEYQDQRRIVKMLMLALDAFLEATYRAPMD